MKDLLFKNRKRNSITNKKLPNTISLNLYTDWLDYVEIVIQIDKSLFHSDCVNVSINELKDFLIKITEKVIHIEYNVFLEENNTFQNSDNFTLYEQKLLDHFYRQYIFDEYPELYDLAYNSVLFFIKNLQNIIDSYINDKDLILDTFNINMSKINYIRMGLGDYHNNHKSVSLIHSDTSSVIYKPRSLEIDKVVYDFFNLYNKLHNTNINIPRVINKETYGWSEFIDIKNEHNRNFKENFYYSIGHLISILYFLNTTDIHFENLLITNDNDIYIIDCETFFYPTLDEESQHSVLSTSLLPSKIKIGDINLDLGGIKIKNQFSNELKKEHSFFNSNGKIETGDYVTLKNTNIYNEFVSEKDILNNIIDGFKKSFFIFLNNKNIFIDFFNKISTTLKVRYISRHTMVYSNVLENSINPELLTNKIDRLKFFDCLKLSFDSNSKLSIYFKSEVYSLLNFDIPSYFCEFKSEKVNGSNLNSPFFFKSPYDSLIQKILNTNKKEYKKQALLIKYSFLQDTSKIDDFFISEKTIKKIIKKTCNFFNKITYNSFSYPTLITSLYNQNEKDISYNNIDLFSGISGDILLLSEIDLLSDNLNIKSTIDNLFNIYIDSLNIYIDEMPLGMSGIGGFIYSNLRLFDSYNDYNYIIKTEELLKKINFDTKILNCKNYGITNGLSGLLISLIYLFDRTNKTYIERLIHKVYDAIIINHNEYSHDKIYWNAEYNKLPLCGIAHGASGIVLALLKYYKYFKKDKCLELIKKAINYENLYFNDVNWKDNRDFIKTNENSFSSYGWSHGAPGIGIIRLELIKSSFFAYDSNFSEILEDNLNKSLKSTMKYGFDGKDNIIFGNYGNAELLYNYSIYTNNRDILSFIDRKISFNLNSLYLIDNNRGVLISGLFNGLSGCVYQMLYFNKKIKKSILTFDF